MQPISALLEALRGVAGAMAGEGSDSPDVETGREHLRQQQWKEARDDVDGALADLNKALDLDPDDADARQQRGVILSWETSA